MVERGKKGFTLIEMLIVLIIIAVLAVVVLPRIMNARRRAKDEATRQTLAQLNTAVEEFEADIGCYPTALGDMFARPSANYVGKGIAGTTVADVTVVDADTLWKGPYFKAAAVPAVPLGNGSWTLITDTLTLLGKVRIVGITTKAVDGSNYTDW